MRRIATVTTLALLLGTAASWAGEYAKCTHSTQECLNMMAERMKTTGWIGVEIETDRDAGYLVQKVFATSPAQAAGIQAGDVLAALNGVAIKRTNQDQLKVARGEWMPGQTVTYTIQRNGADHEVNVTLAPVPADVMARWIGEHMLEHAQIDVAKGTDAAKK